MKSVRIEEDAIKARQFIDKLLHGETDPRELQFPEGLDAWEEVCYAVHQNSIIGYEEGGLVKAHQFAQKVLETIIKRNPEVSELVQPDSQKENAKKNSAPPLLPVVHIDPVTGEKRAINAYFHPDGGKDARTFLDEWIKFSAYWAPRGHFLFHEGSALFLLSALAMRRIMLPYQTGLHTGLMIAFAADSGKYSKSTVIRLVELAFKDIGMGWLPIPKKMTPQMMYSKAAGVVPKNYDQLPLTQKEEFDRQVKVAGQRPFIRDEFGGELAAMANISSNRQPLHQLLLNWDSYMDFDDDFAFSSGEKRVYRPYIPLLVAFTPENMKNITGKGNSDLFQTGLLARMAVLTPSGEDFSLAPMPEGLCEHIPDTLRKRLLQFHERLGMPDVVLTPITNKKGEATGEYFTEFLSFQEKYTRIKSDVFVAQQNYSDHLTVMINDRSLNIAKDLHPWYRRAADKALRIAALLAWIEDDGVITLTHWIAAQTIVERWREGIHNFYEQISELEITTEKRQEDRLETALNKCGGWCSMSELRQQMSTISTERIKRMLDVLLSTGTVLKREVEQPKRGPRLEEPFIYGFATCAYPKKWVDRVIEPKPGEEETKDEATG